MLRKKIRELCREYSDIFSETVRKELKVDLAKWQTHKNRGPPRPHSVGINAEIRRQVELLMKLHVIVASKASEYSVL